MMKWEKRGSKIKTGKQDGEGYQKTVFYATPDDRYRIESRRRAIPHANRSGYWMHTSYFLIVDGEEKEYFSLKDAKAAAEEREAK